MDFKFGDIVLLKFPFTNGLKAKKRPALIIQDSKDGDIVVCRITTKISNDSFSIPLGDYWQKFGLLKASEIRINKIATLEKSLVNIKLGEINTDFKEKTKELIQNLCD